jgi:hypothetical protein
MGTVIDTLGDSTLDNFFWRLVEEEDRNAAVETSVEGQLKKQFSGQEVEVISHAYDGFTTESVLNGGHVGRVLGIGPSRSHSIVNRQYLNGKQIDPGATSYFVRPLDKLKESIEKAPKSIHYVVISVGGNDFRERLLNPIGMFAEIPRVHERYLKIIDEVQKMGESNVRPILMFQYRLDVQNDPYFIYRIMRVVGVVFATMHVLGACGVLAGLVLAGKVSFVWGSVVTLLSAACFGLSTRIIPVRATREGLKANTDLGIATLGGLMETFYSPILARAKNDKIPILDLPNTFNPYKRLYTAQIEPNQAGGKLIAEGIAHIIQSHDFTAESKLYAKRGSDAAYTAQLNPGASGWKVG